jgi:hypothetical protein
VAIIAIKPELTRVQLVAIRNRLDRLVPRIDYGRVRKVGVGTDAAQSAQPEQCARNL